MKSVAELVGKEEWATVNKARRPFVVYKFAATLDGRIAAEDGSSQWITSEASRAEVHVLRAGCDATLIGSGTQLADNPDLSVRNNRDPRLDPFTLSFEHQPLRVVIDSNAKTGLQSKILNAAAPTLIAVAEDASAGHLEEVATLIRVPRAQPGLKLESLLQKLFERGIRGVFLEGGPTLAGSFVKAGLVDRLIAYLAPALLGSGKAGLGSAGISSMNDIRRLELCDVTNIGSDIRIIARPRHT